MAPEALTEDLHIRISKTERDMLNALADRDGMRFSQYLRLLIRKEHEARFGAEASRRKKR